MSVCVTDILVCFFRKYKWKNGCVKRLHTGTGPTLSGDVIGYTGVVLWNVIAHIADIWLIIWALWQEQVSHCKSETHTCSYRRAYPAGWLTKCSHCVSASLQQWIRGAAAILFSNKHSVALNQQHWKRNILHGFCLFTVAALVIIRFVS